MTDLPPSVSFDVARGSVGEVFALIRSGRAPSRSAISRATGLAPSTVSLRVEALTQLGLVVERGAEESRGGRRARRLEVDAAAGVIAAIVVGPRDARLVIADLTGAELVAEVLTDAVVPDANDFATGAWTAIEARLEDLQIAGERLRGVAISVPAPVAHPAGRVVTPSFMPTWHNADLPKLFSRFTDVPVLVENDANLLALAERGAQEGDAADDLLAVKLDTRIGCGIILGGRLYRGAGGAAGEISHTPVDGESAISCACGMPNCLESVASGDALVARLRAADQHVDSVDDIVARSIAGDPAVADAVREAGVRIGAALSSIVNFMNPREVVLGGVLAASAPLVATIRAELYRRCLPLVTTDLEVRTARGSAPAEERGAVLLALEEALSPGRIDLAARAIDDRVGQA